MTYYSVAKAKDGLSGLIAKAQAGEEVIITSRGKPVAILRAAEPARKPRQPGIYDWLQERRNQLPETGMTSVELLQAVYEDYRF